MRFMGREYPFKDPSYIGKRWKNIQTNYFDKPWVCSRRCGGDGCWDHLLHLRLCGVFHKSKTTAKKHAEKLQRQGK